MKKSSIHELSDTRVFSVDNSFDVKEVRFDTRYGFTVAAHLYLPKGFNPTQKYKAIAIAGPFGAVKEQVSGLYAQELARRGFVTMAFDPAMMGESSGAYLQMASPDIFAEDYSAAVDFLTNLDFVNPDEVGVMGICGLSSIALTATINDVRIKAVATSATYDMSESISDHYFGDYFTNEQRQLVKEEIAKRRDAAAKSGTLIRGAHEMEVAVDGTVSNYDTMFTRELPADANDVIKDFHGYYVERSYHPRSMNSHTNAWDSRMAQSFFNFNTMENIEEISPRAVLLISGSKAYSKYFADKIYDRLAEPRQKLIVEDATHVDLYDNMSKIPFEDITAFFEKNLH